VLTSLQMALAGFGAVMALAGLGFGLSESGEAPLVTLFLALGALTLFRFVLPLSFWFDGVLCVLGAVALIVSLPPSGTMPGHFWLAMFAAWAFAWLFVDQLSAALRRGQLRGTFPALLIPVMFGLALLAVWEITTRGAGVPPVLLPAPSAIGARLVDSVSILQADFVQTFIKSVLPGYAIGCLAGLFVAILVDRSPFLKAGLLPIGNFMSALPIIGIAPIMVMWFGFDWQSKAA